jgi:hypothetical protein
VVHPVVGPSHPAAHVHLLGLVQFPPFLQTFKHTAIQNISKIQEGKEKCIRVLHPVVEPLHPLAQIQLLGLAQFAPFWHSFVHTAIKNK